MPHPHQGRSEARRDAVRIADRVAAGVASVSAVGCAGVVALMTVVVVDATLRFTISQPLAGSVEYVSYWSMIPIGFLGMSAAARSGDHIDAPVVFDRLPAALRREFTLLGHALFFAFTLALAWWGWRAAVAQYGVGERGGAAGVIVWPTRFLVPVGAALCAIEIVRTAVKDWRETRPGADLD